EYKVESREQVVKPWFVFPVERLELSVLDSRKGFGSSQFNRLFSKEYYCDIFGDKNTLSIPKRKPIEEKVYRR
ncbi:MAG: hypothetical protein KC535_05850, partial [Nanoarchaeota archaeon]|nr:hypothetical protein [Nanoarchaeota archaeon]